MGLDMYMLKCKKNRVLGIELTIALTSKFAMSEEAEDPDLERFLEKYSFYEKRDDDTARYHYMFKRVAYWRKANHIHKWIYEKCAKENQRDYDSIYVDKNHLVELQLVLENVIKERNNIEYVKKNLPTQSGFFFGSLLYDDAYFDDCNLGVTQITKILEELKDDEIVFYFASY